MVPASLSARLLRLSHHPLRRLLRRLHPRRHLLHPALLPRLEVVKAESIYLRCGAILSVSFTAADSCTTHTRASGLHRFFGFDFLRRFSE